jgi:hypothetical protein
MGPKIYCCDPSPANDRNQSQCFCIFVELVGFFVFFFFFFFVFFFVIVVVVVVVVKVGFLFFFFFFSPRAAVLWRASSAGEEGVSALSFFLRMILLRRRDIVQYQYASPEVPELRPCHAGRRRIAERPMIRRFQSGKTPQFIFQFFCGRDEKYLNI